jgi:DNA primase
LFYCYGCGRGGDVIRFAEIYHQVKFPQALALLREWCGLIPLLDQVTDFYRIQLFRHRNAAIRYAQVGFTSSVNPRRMGTAVQLGPPPDPSRTKEKNPLLCSRSP